jgi:urea transport system ATP-binding protein
MNDETASSTLSSSPGHADPALETRELTVKFEELPAVNSVNLKVAAGELRVIIGANGAGKSTLLDLICGKTLPTSGRIFFHGRDITGIGEANIARAGIGRKFQTPTVFTSLSVWQNLQIAGNESFRVRRNFLRRPQAKPNERQAAVIEQTGLEGVLHRPAAELSHGQLQWLELGMLLVQNPRILLLDEPTAGMTTEETDKTAGIILSLAGSHTVLVIEHDMAFVRQICRTITVLHQGRVLAEGMAEEIERNSDVIKAYLGSATVTHA